MRRLGRIIRFNVKLFIGLLVFVLFVLLAAQYSGTQTWAAKIGAQYLTERLGFDVSIERLYFSDIDKLTLIDLKVIDRTDRIFIDSDTINADLGWTAILSGTSIDIDKLELRGTQFNMTLNPETNTWNVNELVRSIKALQTTRDTTKKTTSIPFRIKKASLHNVQYSLHNPTKDSLQNGMFDYNHFTVNKIYGEIDYFRLFKDTIELNLEKGSLIEPFIGFPVKNMDVFFRYTAQSLQFLDLDAKIGKSHLKDTLIFYYDNVEALSNDFINQVDIYANLEQSEIYFEDLARFAPSLSKYNERLLATGLVRGTVKHLRSKDLTVAFGNNSFIDGRAEIRGLPDLESTFWDLRLQNARLQLADIRQYVSSERFESIKALKTVNFKGSFLGFTSDFVANGTFNTNLGKAVTDIHLNTVDDTYEGKLALYNFDAGALAKSQFLGQITARGNINGKGLEKQTASFEVKANVDSITLKEYPFKNIKVDGNFAYPAFTGELTIQDENLLGDMRGKIDLQDSLVQGRIRIIKSNLVATGFSDRIYSLQGNGNFDLQGLTLNQLTGTAEIRQAQLSLDDQDFELSRISLNSTLKGSFRDIHLESDYINADIIGIFKLQDAIEDGVDTFNEFKMAFLEDSATRVAYYQAKQEKLKREQKDPYQLNYQIEVREINPLIQLVEPDFYITPNSNFEGVFVSNDSLTITLNAFVDSLNYQNFAFYHSDIQLSAIKPADTTGVDVQANINSDRQYFKNALKTENLELDFQWYDRKIAFDTYLKRQNKEDEIDLQGVLTLTDSLYNLNLVAPKFKLLGTQWISEQSTRIGIGKDKFIFQDRLIMQGDSQRVEVIGEISRDPEAILNIGLQNVHLSPFGEFLGEELEGRASGEAFLSGVYDTLKFENNLALTGVVMSGIKIGNLYTESIWDNEKQELAIDANLQYGRREVIDISGIYAPKNEESPLNLDAKIIGMRLNIVEPFLDVVADDFKGSVYGAVKIKGKPSQVRLIGEAFVTGGSFRVDYLNTYYHFDDKITFTEDQIGVDRLRIYDDNENLGYLDGGIYHDGFKNFVMQLSGEMNKMKALDTRPTDNELFYGTAYATGTFELFGPLEQLGITINAKSEAGTKIYLPLSNPEDVSTQSFIRFVNHSDTTLQDSLKTRLRKEDLSSLKMEFNLEITPDAYVELIFDKKVGDVIRGNAEGRLQMIIDTKGDFNMYGDVEIVKGAYNFTFLNIINKEFDVSRGSHITWSGDPFAAQVDLTAQYQQMASLAPIITTADSSVLRRPEITRRYPVVVDLFLKGDLLTPDITFDINVKDYPPLILAGSVPISLESHVAAFKTRIQNDEQEMNRQVFSLILLRRLSAQNAFAGINSSAGSSVSELLSNQLSYLVSQVDENLEIDLNIQGLDADALNTLQLRLSYAFFEGRVRVTREGTFTNVQNQANLASIAGDWTVEYLITPDGTLRMKAYHKNNLNAFNTALQNNSTAGAGLLKIFTFDSFKDLFKIKKKNKKAPFVRDNEIRIEEE